ncbi:uncharacterized protein LOC126746571 [Anthonomus grandis grandis]|uniref:uncharacterized protein LOC126746571 n=1 Tax=Anthonomus grandis grandis TaxID=2921223 RepID=UPI002165DACC|nr:uncharacterized protein LOC126746571 [Anthonomus grandis grandis]
MYDSAVDYETDKIVALGDMNHKGIYCNALKWKEETPVEDLKKRWQNIKDTYNRRKKKGKSTGSAAFPKQTKWALADSLSFLDQIEHKVLLNAMKLKKIGLSKPDSVDLFFHSIAASLKNLRPNLINEAKLRTLHLVFELEQRNTCEPSLCSAPPATSSSVDTDITTSYTSPEHNSHVNTDSPSRYNLLDLDNYLT